MNRRLIITSAALVVCAILVYLYWYGGTPRVGRNFDLRDGNVTSFEVLIQDHPIGSVTNVEVSKKLVALLRSARSLQPHACKNRGRIVLRYSDGISATIPFTPGHNSFRYELAAASGPYAVSRSSFITLMKSAGVDITRIPRD